MAQDVSNISTNEASAIQRIQMSNDYGITEEQAGFVQQFSFIRSRQIDSLAKLGLPADEFRKKRDDVTDDYYRRIYSILTAEQQSRFNPEAFKAARSGEVKVLNLPARTAVEMGGIKAAYLKSVNELNALNLSRPDYKVKKAEIERQYRFQLKALLGESKFAEWQHYKATEHERRFKQTFGFTDDQYRQFIEIENFQAVETLKIKKGSLSSGEKQQKIQKLREDKIEKLRGLLSQESFDKWYEYYQRKEAAAKK